MILHRSYTRCRITLISGPLSNCFAGRTSKHDPTLMNFPTSPAHKSPTNRRETLDSGLESGTLYPDRMLNVYTATLHYRGPDRLDVSRQGGSIFAPSWKLLKPFVIFLTSNGDVFSGRAIRTVTEIIRSSRAKATGWPAFAPGRSD